MRTESRLSVVWARIDTPVRAALLVFLIALSLRLLFGRLIADTYDYDEFVLLLLARDFSHGATPYRDFMFFHPPGALVLLRGLEPLTSLWWPWARIATSVVDAATAVMVYAIGLRVFDRRIGLAAGLMYAISPLALISAARVGQDPLITALGTLGVLACLIGPGRRWSLAAGICLGIGIWIKYPALYFAPVYLQIAPRRFPLMALTTICTLALLMLPFGSTLHAAYSQTVTFQHARWTMASNQRVLTTALFWLGMNVVALPALSRRIPVWLSAGFALGGLFVFTPQVYYHYFVPVVPFGALLAGRFVVDAPRAVRRPLLVCLALVPVATAIVIDRGGYSPLYVTAARLSDVSPTVSLLKARSRGGEPILADRYEYAYLAQRPALDHYFWNVGVLVNAQYLERRVGHARAVVQSTGASSGYPTGFTQYLNRHYEHLKRPTTDIWLVPRKRTPR